MFHRGFKHSKTIKALGLRPHAFISFLVFETPMKHSHSFFEILPPISSLVHPFPSGDVSESLLSRACFQMPQQNSTAKISNATSEIESTSKERLKSTLPAYVFTCSSHVSRSHVSLMVPVYWPCLTGPGEVLPYMGYIARCGPKGYGFSAVLVIDRVSILANFDHFGHKWGMAFAL